MADDPKPEFHSHNLFYNLLAGIAVLLTLVCVAGTVVLSIDPSLPVNPLPPSNRFRLTQEALLPTAAPAPETEIPLVPAPADGMTPPATIQATSAWTPTLTLAVLTVTPTGSRTPASAFPFLVSNAGIRTSVAFQGCAWLGIAGQVFDPLGIPIPNLRVHLEGSLENRPIALDTSTATLPVYGDGAYEFTLGETPIPSENTIWIQLTDNMKRPLSDRILLKTFEGCDRNLILVDFQQVTP
jgi:hypothetical protein